MGENAALDLVRPCVLVDIVFKNALSRRKIWALARIQMSAHL